MFSSVATDFGSWTSKGDQKKTVAISQMFNHVQLHIHWMNLLNTRIYRYITPTVQTLHY